MKAALSVAALSFCIGTAAQGADKPRLPEGPGKAATVRLCGSCHSADICANRRESVEGWNGIVVDMIMRGAKGSDEEFGEVVDYLVAHFPKTAPLPKINVNKASAKDLEIGLVLSPEKAAAVVQYRESNGSFKSIEDLKKVPGIDAAAIEAKKSRLEF